MEKQKQMFDDTRQETLKRLYEAAFTEVRSGVWKGGSTGGWGGQGIRKRARALARSIARQRMREYRKVLERGSGCGLNS